MFKVQNLRMINWKYFPNNYDTPIPLHEYVTALIGPNGSGKSTLIDCLRTVFGETRYCRHRRLGDYIPSKAGFAVIQVELTNPKISAREKLFARLGIYDDTVSICCYIDRKGSSRFEKRYYVVGGAFNYRKDRKKIEPYSPEDYCRLMENVGLSKAVLNVLSLGQGETDRISRQDPQGLFITVLTLCGETKTLNDYEESKKKYSEEEREYLKLNERLNTEKEYLEVMESQKKEFLIYKQKKENKKEYEFNLPYARILDRNIEMEKLLREQKELQEKYDLCLKEQANLTTKVDTLKEELNKQEKIRKKTQDESYEIHSKLSELKQRDKELLETIEGDLKPFVERYSQVKEIPLESIKGKINDIKSSSRKTVAETESLTKEEESIKNRILEIREGIPIYPKCVNSFRDHLKGIEHVLISEVITIPNEKDQRLIETLLENERFRILVSVDDYLMAKELAEQHKYPYLISCYLPKNIEIKKESAYSKLEVTNENAVGWLSWLNNVFFVDSVKEGDSLLKTGEMSLTREGYYQGEDGAIWIDPKHFLIGDTARKIELEYYDRELNETLQKKENALTREKSLEKELNIAQENLNDQINRKQLDEKILELKHVEEKHIEINLTIRKLERKNKEEKNKINQWIENEKKLTAEIGKKNERLRQISKELKDLENQLTVCQSHIDKLYLENTRDLNNLEKSIDEIKKMNLKSASHYEEEIEKIESFMSEFEQKGIPKDIETLYNKRMNQVKELDTKVKEKAEAVKEWKNSTERSYLKYVDYIQKLFSDYRKEFRGLAILINIASEVQINKIGEATWELMIKVGFDKKELLPYNDPNLSGGQSVIVSTLILLAAIRFESAFNFVMIDEHAAHLDFWRTKEIGRLLHLTKAQYILTAPDQPDIEHTDWIDQALVLSIKPPDKDYTHPIHVITKRKLE